jgi:hypothetical protein
MWAGPNVPGDTINNLYLQNINRNQKGTFYCTATNEVGSKTSSNVEVDVRCKYSCNQDISFPRHLVIIFTKLFLSYYKSYISPMD